MADSTQGLGSARFIGWSLTALGFALSVTGALWGEATVIWLETLPGGKWLTVPVPYLPMVLMVLGVGCLRVRD
jgi:hypothetical protein